MVFRKLRSRYRHYKYRNQYDHPGRILAMDILLHGSSIAVFLILCAAIIYLV